MAGCSTYVMSEREFMENARQLISISNSVGDNWQIHYLKGGDVECYLTKRVVINVHLPQKGEESGFAESDQDVEVDEDVSTVNTNCCTPTIDKLCTFEYHIVYSSSYAAPVLYFNAYRQDGHLLKLDDVWSSLPKIHQTHLQDDKWNFLTQQEHPVLHRPFYQLHPCKTGILMALMKECKDTQVPQKEEGEIQNMLVSWLSTVGPVVHLDIPLQYGIHIQQHK